MALPPTLHQSVAEIAEACGEDVACLLVERFAGQRLYVPQDITADHEIARTIGVDAAARLAEHFGGERVAVPKALGPGDGGGARDQVLRLACAGKKVREIAAAARLTEVRVYQILAAERARTGRNPRTDPRQVEMFG